jgi:hypothetical protein
MLQRVSAYFQRLAEGFGHGWTLFWFTPSDPATLSAIRLFTGVIVVYLHATLTFDLVAFFGPEGLLPVNEIAPLEGNTWSYLNYLSTPAELLTVHLLGLAVLVLFAIGLWARVTTVLALVVFLSDVNRAPVLTSLTEPIAAMTMLYLCLAPCGRYYSVDAWFRARRKTDPRLPEAPAEPLSTMSTIATRLIQVHLALFVAMMGLSKLSGDVWWIGTGMWWLLSREESRLADLTWLHRAPMLLDAWTHVIVFFELVFPIAVWIPLARPLLLALGVFVWASIALVTGDVTFALMMCVASLAFISPEGIRGCCGPSAAAAGH